MSNRDKNISIESEKKAKLPIIQFDLKKAVKMNESSETNTSSNNKSSITNQGSQPSQAENSIIMDNSPREFSNSHSFDISPQSFKYESNHEVNDGFGFKQSSKTINNFTTDFQISNNLPTKKIKVVSSTSSNDTLPYVKFSIDYTISNSEITGIFSKDLKSEQLQLEFKNQELTIVLINNNKLEKL